MNPLATARRLLRLASHRLSLKPLPVSELAAPETLDLLDGYLFREMVHIFQTEGPDVSGYVNYYTQRVTRGGRALSGYDRMLVEYFGQYFDRPSRRVLHVGPGLGTLAAALAADGFTVAAVERDELRFRSTQRLRAALIEAWPSMAERYQLVAGSFPEVLEPAWLSANTVLVFTNCVASWSAEFTAGIIELFPRVGDVLLDTRVFGNLRESAAERQVLIEQIEAQGLHVSPIEATPAGSFYVHVTRRD